MLKEGKPNSGGSRTNPKIARRSGRGGYRGRPAEANTRGDADCLHGLFWRGLAWSPQGLKVSISSHSALVSMYRFRSDSNHGTRITVHGEWPHLSNSTRILRRNGNAAICFWASDLTQLSCAVSLNFKSYKTGLISWNCSQVNRNDVLRGSWNISLPMHWIWNYLDVGFAPTHPTTRLIFCSLFRLQTCNSTWSLRGNKYLTS